MRPPDGFEARDCSNYGDEDIPFGLKLGAHFLQTHDWRVAFLNRLTEVGYIGLIEAAARVYDLLGEPKAMRCALIAQHAGVTGSGKQAIYSALNNFLDEFLLPPPYVSRCSGESLASWHSRVTAGWNSERAREEAVVVRFAQILDGQNPASDAPKS